MRRISLFVLAVWLGAGPQAIRADDKRPLLWAADAEGGAPYVFGDPNNPDKNEGFEVEIAAALAKELGRPIEFKQYDFKNLIPGLERGDFDFAMNGLEITPDRKEKVRFSRPYYVYKLQLVVRATTTASGRSKTARRSRASSARWRIPPRRGCWTKAGIQKKIYDGQVRALRRPGPRPRRRRADGPADRALSRAARSQARS